MRRIVPVIAGAALLLGCEQPTATIDRPTLAVGGAVVVHSQTTTTQSMTFSNTCTGDEVTFEDTEIRIETQVTDPTGGSVLINIGRFTASAESEFGDQYRLVLSSSLSQVVSTGGVIDITVPARVLLMGQGTGQVSAFNGVFHVTLVDGQTIVEFDTFDTEGACWVQTVV
jgi:hypothetical protein